MKYTIPLVPHRVGNIICARPQVIIRVVSRYGLSPIRFSCDTGADLTTLPIPLARREGIAFSESESARGTATGLVGSTIRYRGSAWDRLVRRLWPLFSKLHPPRTP